MLDIYFYDVIVDSGQGRLTKLLLELVVMVSQKELLYE
jgi:hypothetical protein